MVKVITVKQPWAHLIVENIKDVENRTWKTKHRGEIYIHTSKNAFDSWSLNYIKNMDGLLYQYIIDYFGIKNSKITKHQEQFGSIIGKTNIIDVIDDSNSIWAMKDSSHWILKDSERIDNPIPCNGQLNVWNFSGI